MSSSKPPRQPRTTAETAAGRAARAERLAREMRANLRKRKERQRALDEQGQRDEDPADA
jgi:hypothetical protein